MVQLAERAVQRVILVKHVIVLIVAVQEIIRRAESACVVPILFYHAAEAVQAGVLVASIAGAAALRNERLVDVGLRMIALDDGVQPKVLKTFERGTRVGNGTEPADGGVHSSIIVVIQHPAVGIGHAQQATVVGTAGQLVIGIL